MKAVINQEGVELPEDDFYYVIGKNGAFLTMNTPMVKATIRHKGELSGLEDVQEDVRWMLPKIPGAEFARIAKFFHDVGKKHHTEVGVQLHFNFKTGEWLVSVPSQEVTGGHISYTASERFPGFRLVGTMHSHVDMAAHHSWTDERDETEADGLHITVGKVGRYPALDMDAKVFLRGNQYDISPEDVISDIVPEKKEFEEDNSKGNYFTRNWFSYDRTSHIIKAKPLEIPKTWWNKLKVIKWTSTYTDYWKGGKKGRGKGKNGNDDDYGFGGANDDFSPYGF